MTAIARYWRDFTAWVKGRNRLLPTMQPIPVETWADRKLAYERARTAHHGQGLAYEHLRQATNAALIQSIFADEAKCARLPDTHPWLFRDPDAFVAAVKATARRRVAEASR